MLTPLITAVHGEQQLDAVEVQYKSSIEKLRQPSAGTFIFIGATPCSDFIGNTLCKDAKGFIQTGAQVTECQAWPLENRQPLPLETSIPGVFAAGDCRSNTAKRVAFAVGDGALAVNCVHDLLGTYA